MLGMTGFRLVNAPTFLPAYIHQVSGSNTIVGLALALQQFGGVVAPIFTGSQVEHRKKVMPAAMWMGGLGRVAILCIALSGWFLKGPALTTALLFFIGMFGLFMGAQRVVFSLLLSKVIPLSRRGRLQAWRSFTGSMIAAVLAWVAGKYFVGKNLFGNGYSTTFVFAFVLTSLGLSALQILLREPEPPTTRPQARFRDRLRDFPQLIAQDRSYGFFLLVQMLSSSARIATPFYILFVGRLMPLTGELIGTLTTILLVADMLSNLLWGNIGDRTGFRLVLLFAMVIWLAATVLLLEVHALPAIYLAFFGLGAAQAGYLMSTQTMILEFGAREDLPMRIAVSATAESITATAGPLIGGWMADLFGYNFVFGASVGMLAMALLILLGAVPEPRTARLAAL
ncbi:MAG: MFS transporter [Proteobacteria bacterium]|nr:MFS transporter [Pseudomonadota bacterium]